VLDQVARGINILHACPEPVIDLDGFPDLQTQPAGQGKIRGGACREKHHVRLQGPAVLQDDGEASVTARDLPGDDTEVEREAHLFETPSQKDGGGGIRLPWQQALVPPHHGHLQPPPAKPVARLDTQDSPADHDKVLRGPGPPDHGIGVRHGVEGKDPFQIVAGYFRDHGAAARCQKKPIIGVGLPVGGKNRLLDGQDIDDFRGEPDLDPILLVPGAVVQGQGPGGLLSREILRQGGPVIIVVVLPAEHANLRSRFEFPDGLGGRIASHPVAHDHVTAHFIPFMFP